MDHYNLTDLFPMLGVPGPDLLTRSFGRRALPALEHKLGAVPDGQALLIECAGVAVMDTSFTEETLLALGIGLSEGRYGDRFLVLQDPTEEVVDNLDGAIARRRSREGSSRTRVAFLVRWGRALDIVGHIEPNLGEAWRLALDLPELTARDLADRLDLEINTASMRLRKLYDARLLARHEEITPGGRQHIYRLPI